MSTKILWMDTSYKRKTKINRDSHKNASHAQITKNDNMMTRKRIEEKTIEGTKLNHNTDIFSI